MTFEEKDLSVNQRVLVEMNGFFNAGDVDAALAPVAEEVRFEDPGAPLDFQGVGNRDDMKRVYGDWAKTFAGLTATIEGMEERGERIVCTVSYHGTGEQGGAAVELRTFDAYEFRDGLMVHASIGNQSDELAWASFERVGASA